MEMKLIEIVLVLVAMYLVLALAASQFGELLAATTGRRNANLSEMIKEAFSGDVGLVNAFYSHGPIFALSKGDNKPSAIPADLFATSYIAVLNGGDPPRAKFRTPAEFCASIKTNNPGLKQILAAHLAGAESDWNVFEARIAVWFSDIGDRADGWYKKSSAKRIFFISLALVVLTNADTLNIIRNLMENQALRVSLANLAEQAAAKGSEEQGRLAASAPPAAAEPTPTERLNAAAGDLGKARSALRAAGDLDKSLYGIGSNVGSVMRLCAEGISDPVADKKTKAGAAATGKGDNIYESNFDAWISMLPDLQIQLKRAAFELGVCVDPGSTKCSKSEVGVALDVDKKVQRLRALMVCVGAMQPYVEAAYPRNNDERALTRLAEANAALNRALAGMHMVVNDSMVQEGLSRTYARLGAAFTLCAEDAGQSRAKFDKCIETENGNAIPLGWPAKVGQFCDVQSSGVAEVGGGLSELFGCRDFEARPALKIGAIHVAFSWGKLLAALFGLALTVIMVSLGAPFWFDLLGKVASVRIAGRVRKVNEEAAAAAAAARGSQGAALPPPVAPSGEEPFDSARNEFERGLRPNEIGRLQMALDVPPTRQLDQITRNKLTAKMQELGLGQDQELGAATYEAIVGRRAAWAAPATAAAGVWVRGQKDGTELAAFAASLGKLFPAPTWLALPIPADQFSDDMRARVVLYQFKMEAGISFEQRKAVLLANKRNGELTQLSANLRREIEAKAKAGVPFSPEVPPWLDFALGELGISEDGQPAQSDPRVIEYFKELGAAPITGDDTPWCGAFAGWVMSKAGLLTQTQYAARPDTLLWAMSWVNYGKKAAQPYRAGDICIVRRNGQNHVAFWMGQDQTSVCLLGGNQGSGTNAGAVTMVRFRLGADGYSIVDVRRP